MDYGCPTRDTEQWGEKIENTGSGIYVLQQSVSLGMFLKNMVCLLCAAMAKTSRYKLSAVLTGVPSGAYQGAVSGSSSLGSDGNVAAGGVIAAREPGHDNKSLSFCRLVGNSCPCARSCWKLRDHPGSRTKLWGQHMFNAVMT